VVSNLGVPCGLAFAPDGALFVGDRSGTIFRASVETGEAMPIASLPPSVAAFHLAFGPDGWLYVTGPTLSPSDPVRRIDPATGAIEVVVGGFGRPQGLAFDRSGVLHVVDALAGGSGVFRVVPGERPQLAVAGTRLVGVAFDSEDGFVVASSEALYRFDRAADPRA
jgi:sugar lactone lactonase YvrE